MALKPQTDSQQVCLLNDLNMISIDKRSCLKALLFNRSPAVSSCTAFSQSYGLCCFTLIFSYGQDVCCLVKQFLSVPPSNAVKNVLSCQKHCSIHYVLRVYLTCQIVTFFTALTQKPVGHVCFESFCLYVFILLLCSKISIRLYCVFCKQGLYFFLPT